MITVTNNSNDTLYAELKWNRVKASETIKPGGSTTFGDYDTGKTNGWIVNLYEVVDGDAGKQFVGCDSLSTTASISVSAHGGTGANQSYGLSVDD